MRIRLDRIRDEPFRWHETFEVSPEELERPDLLALTPILVKGEVKVAHPGHHFQARLSYEQQMSCDRCLQPVLDKVESELELLLLTGSLEAPPEEDEEELGADDLSVVHLAEEELDTRPLVVEQLQLNFPMKPLCEPDCPGLCPVCGTRRMRTAEGEIVPACTCEQHVTDPRWAALAAFKKRSD